MPVNQNYIAIRCTFGDNIKIQKLVKLLHFSQQIAVLPKWYTIQCTVNQSKFLFYLATTNSSKILSFFKSISPVMSYTVTYSTSGGFKGGGGRPLSTECTECILKQAKILHENALFLHKNFKNFLRRGHGPFPGPYPYPSALYSKFMDPPLYSTNFIFRQLIQLELV